jgi:hypothetical protein
MPTQIQTLTRLHPSYAQQVNAIVRPDMFLYADGRSQLVDYFTGKRYGTDTVIGTPGPAKLPSVGFVSDDDTYAAIDELAPATMPAAGFLHICLRLANWGATPGADAYVFRCLYVGVKDDIRVFKSSVDGKVYLRVETNNTVRTASFDPSGLSGFHHITVQYDVTDKAYLYLDGVYQSETIALTAVAGDALAQAVIGALTQAPTGEIDMDLMFVAWRFSAVADPAAKQKLSNLVD